MGNVIQSVGDEQVFGKSRMEIEAMNRRNPKVGIAALDRLVDLHRVGGALAVQALKHQMMTTGLPVHVGFTCQGCKSSPLLGWRYRCTGSARFDLCGACYPGRAHAHQLDHIFRKTLFPESEETVAERPLQAGQGAIAVVCSSGNCEWDGMRVEVSGRDPAGTGWLVSSNSLGSITVRGENLFLRSESDEGFDAVSGLPVSRLGKQLRVQWCQLPVVVAGGGGNPGDVVWMIGNTALWGLSRAEVEEVHSRNKDASLRVRKRANLLKDFQDGGEVWQHTKAKLLESKLPVHPGAECWGCKSSPVVGWCYRCTNCQGFHLCGSCYVGRAHA